MYQNTPNNSSGNDLQNTEDPGITIVNDAAAESAAQQQSGQDAGPSESAGTETASTTPSIEKDRMQDNRSGSYSSDDEVIGQYREENWFELALKYAGVFAILLLCRGFVGFADSITTKCIIAFVLIFIFFIIPRTFYIRYYHIYRNNEMSMDFNARSIVERIVYSTRRNLSSIFMFTMTGFILFYTLVGNSAEGRFLVLTSFILYAVLNSLFNLPIVSKIMKASRKPNVFRFYRRFIVCFIIGIITFSLGYFRYQPSLTLEQSKAVIFGGFETDYENNLFTIFLQTINFIIASVDFTLLSLKGTYYYEPVKAVLVAMPLGIFGCQTAIIFSLLCMPFAEIGSMMKKQKWMKQRKCFLFRYWKTIALPLFLTVFLAVSYNFGYPKYIEFQQKVMMDNDDKIKADAELIGGVKYKNGTFKEISRAKQNGLNELHLLLTTASTEINDHFSELNETAELFINWYQARNKQYPFTAGDSQLKQSFISTMKIKNLDNSLNNMRKDIARAAEDILNKTKENIDEILKNNKLDEKAEVRKLSQNIDPDSLYMFYTSDKVSFSLLDDLKQQIKLPSVETIIVKEFDNPDSVWFNNKASRAMQSIEDQLFGTETEGNSQNIPAEEEESDNKIINNTMLKHLLASLDSCRIEITEALANSLKLPLEDPNTGKSKDRPKNNAIGIDESGDAADDTAGDDAEDTARTKTDKASDKAANG